MPYFKKEKLFWIILFALVGIRLINITMPILEGTAMRQVQTAMIARNFYREGFNILYPKMDFFGNAPGYVVLEFPMLNTLAALGYRILGGVYEWVGRLLSILFFAGAASFLYGIIKRVFDKDSALWAVVVFGILPLSIIFSRTFMPDSVMLFFCMGAVYFFLGFYLKGKYSRYWLSALFLSLALLVKAHSFYILVPLVYLIWKKQSWRFVINYKNWIYLLIAVVPAVLWYLHGNYIHNTFTPEWLFNYQVVNWFDPKEFLNKDLYINMIKIYAGIFLTPIGLTLFIGGLFIKTKGNQNLIWAWLAGGVLFLIAFVTHINDPYYNLNILPIASIFIARMIVFMQGLDWRKTFLNYRWAKLLLVMLIFPFWIRYTAYAYIVPKGYRYIPEAGRRIQEISNRDDLIIASAAGGAQALYFCDRKGWSFLLPGSDATKGKKAIEKLESLGKKGAKYFVGTVMGDFNKSPLFKEYMLENYRLIECKAGKYIIFSLVK